MFSPNPKSPNELRVVSIPLINISRSPSPYQRRYPEFNHNSDTEEDESGDSLRTPFLPQEQERIRGYKRLFYGGACGRFFFNTPLGWQIYVSILVLWLGGSQIGLILMNRIILWTGVYKFPYPLTTTYFEMLITHFWILLSAYITRWLKPWLTKAGFSGGIAPSRPLKNASSQAPWGNSRTTGKYPRWAHNYHEGGIAGGGFLEFDVATAKVVLPSAIIFVAKVCLSNLSFAYAQLQIYFLARIGVVPLSLIFTYILFQTSHSVATISSALTATLTLLVATSRSNVRVTWESIIAGIFSSLFVSLYPIQLFRSYKALVSQLVSQGELLGTSISSPNQIDFSGSREECRAYWRLLHYTSLLSIMIFTPIVLLSGEVKNIWRNCYFLDVFFHWLMVLCGGLGSWAVFWATIALTRATNPLVVAFLSIPRAAFLLPVMSGRQMPVHSWIGIGMCWASCFWFFMAQKKKVKN